MPPLAEFIAHDGQELCFPVANSLMADLEAAEEQDLAQVPQGQPVAQAAAHHEGDDVTRQAGPVQRPGAAFVELLAALPASEPTIASRRQLPVNRT